MGPEVPVRPHDKKVNVLDLGLTSLLEEHEADDVGYGEEVGEELKKKESVHGVGEEVLAHKSVPEPGHLG